MWKKLKNYLNRIIYGSTCSKQRLKPPTTMPDIASFQVIITSPSKKIKVLTIDYYFSNTSIVAGEDIVYNNVLFDESGIWKCHL